jgi:signal transduction histidine kinase
METRTSLDALDLRIILLVYAVAAAVAGFLPLTTPGPVADLLRASANGSDSLIFVTGTGLIAWGLIAVGLSTIPNAVDRRRAFGWFVAAHFLVLAILLAERLAVWPAGVADGIVGVWALASFLLFYSWATAFGDPSWWRPQATRFGPARRSGIEHLRTQYEQSIRTAAAQEERHRLARDLHDSIRQQIFAIQTAAATAETRLDEDACGAREALDMVRASAREAMTDMEAMTEPLKAAPLENAGLVAALRRQCEALRFRTGGDVELTIGDLPRDEQLTPGTQQAIFRVAQEALSNVARHARATHVTVSLHASKGRLALVIQDNGAGYEPSPSAGSGLSNMRTRANELAGAFAIAPAPGGGTAVRFDVPFSEASPQCYSRKLRGAAVGLAIVAVTVIVVRPHSGWNMWWLVVIPTFELIRYLVAWVRSRRMTASAT